MPILLVSWDSGEDREMHRETLVISVKVSSVYPKRQSSFLLTVCIRASRRTRKIGMSSAAMSQRWLAKLHCDGRCLVILAQIDKLGRWYLSSTVTTFSRMMLTFNVENIDSVKKHADWSSFRNALSYMWDPRKIDGMKKLDAILVKFQVCSCISFFTIHVHWDANVKLQTNIAAGHTLASVVKNDVTILSKLDSIENQLFDISTWWALWVCIVLPDDAMYRQQYNSQGSQIRWWIWV